MFSHSTLKTTRPGTAKRKGRKAAGKRGGDSGANNPHGRIRVVVRLRPPLTVEVSDRSYASVVDTVSSGTTARVDVHTPDHTREFHYDAVLGPAAGQEAVYAEVAAPIVERVLSGYNGTLIAYGQTGTGKTYTLGILSRMRDSNCGVVPRALYDIFNHINTRLAARDGTQWRVSISFVQIYNDSVQDLLSSALLEYGGEDGDVTLGDENLDIREDPDTGFYVDNLEERDVTDFEAAVDLVTAGLENRVMASTLMNATSSRSHVLLTITVRQRRRVRDAASNAEFTSYLTGKLVVVDLAGSERVKKTTSEGTRLDEARAINQSLSALGNVIAAIVSKATHVPFRDSKLTRLLQNSLVGNSETVVVATVGPSKFNRDETLSTLTFAQRCMKVQTHAKLNEDTDFTNPVDKLKHELARTKQQHEREIAALRADHNSAIASLRSQLQQSHTEPAQTRSTPSPHPSVSVNEGESQATITALYTILQRVYEASVVPIHSHVREQERRADVWNDQDAGGAECMPGLSRRTAQRIYDSCVAKVEDRYPFEGATLNQSELPPLGIPHPGVGAFASMAGLVDYAAQMGASIESNVGYISRQLASREAFFTTARGDLVNEEVERYRRHEELINWARILKYLLTVNAQLRADVVEARARLGLTTNTNEPHLDANGLRKFLTQVKSGTMPAAGSSSSAGRGGGESVASVFAGLESHFGAEMAALREWEAVVSASERTPSQSNSLRGSGLSSTARQRRYARSVLSSESSSSPSPDDPTWKGQLAMFGAGQ